MREPVTKLQAFRIAIDLFTEAGEPELARLMYKAAAPRTDVARLLQAVADKNWEEAQAHLAAIERKANGIPDSELDEFIDWAVGYHDDILDDGSVEVGRQPRILRQPADQDGRHGYAISGWFHLRPGWSPEEEEDVPLMWHEMSHDQQMWVLAGLTDAEQDSIRIEGPNVTGRPRDYAYIGMRVDYGRLIDLLERAIVAGYVRRG